MDKGLVVYQPGIVASPLNSASYTKNIFLIPGFLTEMTDQEHGAHNITDTACFEKSEWTRHFTQRGDDLKVNIYYFNWASGTLHDSLKTFATMLMKIVGFSGAKLAFTTLGAFSVLLGPAGLAASTLLSAFELRQIRRIWQEAVNAADCQALGLVDIINRLGGETHVLGHSLGGRIAVRLLEQHSRLNVDKLYISSLAPAITEDDFRISLVNPNYRGEIFYSKHDLVLKLIYKLGEGKFADPLGYVGPKRAISENPFAGIDVSSTSYCPKMRHTLYEHYLPDILASNSCLWKAFTGHPDSVIPA